MIPLENKLIRLSIMFYYYFSATKCYNPKGNQEKDAWFVPFGSNACCRIEDIADDEIVNNHITADNVVFSVRMPQRNQIFQIYIII